MSSDSFPENVVHFLQEKNFLVLATTRGDGSPQVTPIWYLYEDSHFVVNVMNGRAKVANIRRDPRVAFVIQDLQNPYRYVQVRGRVVHTEAGETGHNDIDRLSERYTGNPRYQGDPNRETNRITYRIEPEWHQTMGF